MNILITICARSGSKGVVGKNIKIISGRPLLNYSIETAKKFSKKYKVKIALSTNDETIRQIAQKAGLFSQYLRPDYLATDNASKIETIKDLVLYEESLVNYKYDLILDLDVTSPLRTIKDIESGLEKLIKNNSAVNLFSVSHASRNPYFNMVEVNDLGFASLVKKSPSGSIINRQSAPKVFELNASFYWYKRVFFDLNLNSTITDKSIIFEMNHICFDIDNQYDFLFMEFLLNNNKLDFEL